MQPKEKQILILNALYFYVWNYDDIEVCKQTEKVLVKMLEVSGINMNIQLRFDKE